MATAKRLMVVLALLNASLFCLAQESTTRDGNWWNHQDENTKVAYLIGFFDGTQLGHNFSWWKVLKDKKSDCMTAVRSSFIEYDKYISNITSSQLADGLDEFFKDYRNRSIWVTDAVWLVANEIAGTPKKQLDEMIENFRRSAARTSQ